jgi:Glycosyl transferase family 2
MSQAPRPLERLSFIVPVKNDAARLKACLETIERNRPGADREIVVVDNGSTDASREVAAAAGARVETLPGLRVSELRNRGAAGATGDVLAFVDADHLLAETWAASVVDVLGDANVGAVGALCLSPAQGTWVQRMYGALRGRTRGRSDTRWLGAGNMAVRRTAFESVGGFDAALEACEDVDLCNRLRAAGWRIVADERLENVHLGDPASLGRLFRAERWRATDNVRVTLRGPVTLRDLPSVLVPVIDLAAMAAVALGAVTLPIAGRASVIAIVIAASVMLGLSALRAARAFASGTLALADLPRGFAVAVVWDAARALALVWPAPHHGRRRTGLQSGAAAT